MLFAWKRLCCLLLATTRHCTADAMYSPCMAWMAQASWCACYGLRMALMPGLNVGFKPSAHPQPLYPPPSPIPPLPPLQEAFRLLRVCAVTRQECGRRNRAVLRLPIFVASYSALVFRLKQVGVGAHVAGVGVIGCSWMGCCEEAGLL